MPAVTFLQNNHMQQCVFFCLVGGFFIGWVFFCYVLFCDFFLFAWLACLAFFPPPPIFLVVILKATNGFALGPA